MPVVTTKRGGVQDTVQHGVTGYLCEDDQELERVVASGCVKEIKPEDCVGWVRQNFTVEKMVDRYVELFERVRAGHRW